MIFPPLNDEDCLCGITARAFPAMHRPDVRELAARLRTLAAADRYIRLLPQLDDGPDDPTPGPREQCDVPQRVRIVPKDPNCVERALARMVLGELIDPRPARQLMTVQLDSGRHTLLVENGEPVWLDPLVPRNALRAGLHLVRNALGQRNAELSAIDALRWLVDLAGEPANKSATGSVRHRRAVADVGRIAKGLLPVEPASLSWALKQAVPEALMFGPEGPVALMLAANLLDALAGTPSDSAAGTKPSGSTSAAGGAKQSSESASATTAPSAPAGAKAPSTSSVSGATPSAA